MLNIKTLPKVLLFLAIFVFFSANSIYILEAESYKYSKNSNNQITFDFENANSKGLRLNLKAAMVVNYENGDVLYTKNAEKIRSVASLTKLVTAMVLLDKKIDLSQTVVISKEDAYKSSKSRLRIGYELSMIDLLHAAMLSSDNRAARAIARTVSGSLEAFSDEMNLKVRQLGLENTEFFEPTGLDPNNRSTAHEILKVMHYSYQYKLIREITKKKLYYVKIKNKNNKKLQMVNTNIIVHSKYKVLAGKTGYTIASDYCLTTIVKNNKGERLSIVVLGVPGDKLRFREARKLIDWGFNKIKS
jgi:D-alanyl-D-alanine endopeptidase (penicillin-binding protein 7)